MYQTRAVGTLHYCNFMPLHPLHPPKCTELKKKKKKNQYCFGVQSQTPHRWKAQSCGSQGMAARLNSQNAVYLFCRLFPPGCWSVSFRALLAVRLKCVFCFFDVVSGRIHCLLHTIHFLLYFSGTVHRAAQKRVKQNKTCLEAWWWLSCSSILVSQNHLGKEVTMKWIVLALG